MPDTSSSEDLAAFVTHMGGGKALKVEESLGSGFVRLRIDEAERRQARHDIRCSEDIVIELLRNARDAGARSIFVATGREGRERTIVMIDDGDGIPPALWDAIFEARVTSKLESVHLDRWGVHGRGMALFSIRENSLDAHVATSLVGGGSSIFVRSDTSSVPERADQSSWPHLGTDDSGAHVIERGPHNIIRTCCEFALEEHGTCEIYLGSLAEMVATMRYHGRAALRNTKRLFESDLSQIPVVERFAIASDAKELCHEARACGLEISERTAQRILSCEISPVRSVYAHMVPKEPEKAPRRHTVRLDKDRRGLRLAPDDAEEFVRLMERDFEMLAERYYLTLSDAPKLRVTGGRLTVTFDYEGQD